MLTEQISRQLNRMRISFEPRDNAPFSFEELLRHGKGRILPIWAGASDRTIYADPRVNWMFRAWHDACHLLLNAPFTLEGEKCVARFQAGQVGDEMGKIVWAEVAGQAEYLHRTGCFPTDQVKFVSDYIRR